jgi:hypothetical protein
MEQSWSRTTSGAASHHGGHGRISYYSEAVEVPGKRAEGKGIRGEPGGATDSARGGRLGVDETTAELGLIGRRWEKLQNWSVARLE